MCEVARVVRPSRAELYANYIDPAIPVVIAGQSDALLTPDMLRQRFENKPVSVGVAEGRTLRPNPKMREIPFDDYATYVENAPEDVDLEYAFQIPLDATFGNGTLAPFLPDAERIRDRLLWFGPSGTVLPLHFDEAHNFFHQHYGSKHVTLVSPTQFESLRPDAKDAPDRHMSSIDPSSAAGLSCLTAVVHAGDVLFIPAFWWHRVEAVGAAISVTYFWRPPLGACLHPGFFRLLSSRRVFGDPAMLAETIELDGEVDLSLCRSLADLGHEFGAAALAGALVTKYRLTSARMTSSQSDLLKECVALGEEAAAADAPLRYPAERARAIRALICQLDSEFGGLIKAGQP